MTVSASEAAPAMVEIGVVGDLHGSFDATDVYQLDACRYEALWFVGDLGPGTRDADVRVARTIAKLRTPVVVMPGNNDCEHAPLLRAEFGHQVGRSALLALGGVVARGESTTRRANVRFAGFDRHVVAVGESGVTVVSGRPYAMGGDQWPFAEAMQSRFGLGSVAQSAERLVSIVDGVETESVVFLAHNGPTGLGTSPVAPWGRDFHPGEGDHGDRDLRVAVDHARARGLRVLAVVAGHMHYPLDDGRLRTWAVEVDGTTYVNAARLPRVRATRAGGERHHVRLRLEESAVTVDEVWLSED
jgi:uncharacterized protein (TIGR04168 family)